MPIIDVHSHIGNILYEGGGKLIHTKVPDRSLFDTGFKLRNILDAGWYAAIGEYRQNKMVSNSIIRAWATYSGRQRNFSSTLENMQKSLDASFVDYVCLLPIAPNVTFEDLMTIEDKRVILFTSIDFTR